MFILAERLKLSYCHYQVQKAFWFCESCVHFEFTNNLSVHMTWKFAIQSFTTLLNVFSLLAFFCSLLLINNIQSDHMAKNSTLVFYKNRLNKA